MYRHILLNFFSRKKDICNMCRLRKLNAFVVTLLLHGWRTLSNDWKCPVGALSDEVRAKSCGDRVSVPIISVTLI